MINHMHVYDWRSGIKLPCHAIVCLCQPSFGVAAPRHWPGRGLPNIPEAQLGPYADSPGLASFLRWRVQLTLVLGPAKLHVEPVIGQLHQGVNVLDLHEFWQAWSMAWIRRGWLARSRSRGRRGGTAVQPLRPVTIPIGDPWAWARWA